MQPITFVGLDVHKATIAVSVTEGGRDGEVRHLGRVENRPEVVRRLVERLRRGGQELRVWYEAGPCGYGLHRQLTELGCHCVVVAPALIPRRPGDRVKTDRRDATALATLHRAGELTPVWVPMLPTKRCAIWCGHARPPPGPDQDAAATAGVLAPSSEGPCRPRLDPGASAPACRPAF
jgi:Transposase